MKQRITIVILFIIGIITLSLIGYAILPSTYIPQIPVDGAEKIYTDATEKINLKQDMELTIIHTQEMTINNSVFLETAERIVQYDVTPSGNTNIYMQETLNSGTLIIPIEEYFIDGSIYTTVNGAAFSSTIDATQYLNNMIPAIVLDQHLYSSITGIDNGSEYIISFTDPIDAESWLTKDAVTLQSATGTATVSYDGILTNCEYTVSYESNGISYRTTVSIGAANKSVDITPPQDTARYTPISYWEGPKALERACGFLIQANHISSVYNDNIYFQAIGDRRTQSINAHGYKDTLWSANITTETALVNDTKLDQVSTHRKQELFVDNQYSISTNDESAVINADIDADAMHNYFQNQIVSTIMLPQYIASADITENEDTLHITFIGNDAFASFLAENACQVLYQDPTLVAGKQITLKNLQCYLEINKKTGLPLASGIDFLGTYKTEGLPYQIQYTAEQTYTIPSDTAKDKINEAAGK